MKRWALLTAALYLIGLVLLTSPILVILDDDEGEFAEFFAMLIPFLILVQAVLLLVPVAIVRERPIARRSIGVSAFFAGIPMAAMAYGVVMSSCLIIWGEEDALEYLPGGVVLALVLACWLGWGFFFYRAYKSDDPRGFVSMVSRWLLRGSILEVVVAIPSHVIARQRAECCAPGVTLLGIVTGLSIALMSFGPGVFFLFAKRIREKKGMSQQPRTPDDDHQHDHPELGR